MLHVKNAVQEEKFYISIMLSLLLNTVCSRFVDQTDLIMIRRLSQDAAAALISVKSISFLDFIIALSVVPIFGILVRKSVNQKEKEIHAAQLLKKFLVITALTTVICALAYPALIFFSVKDSDLKSMCLVLVIFIILNLPCKMLQFLFSTFLCIFKKANFVSIFWIITVFVNFILNYIFIKLFGFAGCLISTIIVTFIVSLSFFIKLNKDFNLIKNLSAPQNEQFKIPFTPIASEGSRIVIEQIASYLFFLLAIHFCSRSDFTNIGIISTITSLFLVPSIASMRGTALSLSNQTNSIKNKLFLNCIISFLIILFFFFLSNPIIEKLYGIDSSNNKLLSLYKITLPFLIFTKSQGAIFRGKVQFHLKQKTLFKIDTCLTWGLYLPLCLLIFAISKEYLFPAIVLLQSLIELIILIIQNRIALE